MSVQHSLNPSVSWHNARLYLGMASVPTQRPVPPGMKQALAPLWNMKSLGQSHLPMTNRMVENPAKLQDAVPVIMVMDRCR